MKINLRKPVDIQKAYARDAVAGATIWSWHLLHPTAKGVHAWSWQRVLHDDVDSVDVDSVVVPSSNELWLA